MAPKPILTYRGTFYASAFSEASVQHATRTLTLFSPVPDCPMGRTTMVSFIAVTITGLIHGALALSPGAASSVQALLGNSPIPTRQAPLATSTPDLGALKASILAGNYSRKVDLALSRSCPQPCTADPKQWYIYHSLDRLAKCDGTLLLDFALVNPLNDSSSPVSIAACTANLADISAPVTDETCVHSGVSQKETNSSLERRSSGSSSASVAEVIAALKQLEAYSALTGAGCNETINFAKSGSVVVGIYAGSRLTNQGLVSSVITQLSTQVQGEGNLPEELLVQLCENHSARYSLGIYISTNSDLSSAQHAVQSWKNNTCVTSVDATVDTAWQKVSYLIPSSMGSNSSAVNSTIPSSNSSIISNRAAFPRPGAGKLDIRDTCSTVKVVAHDTCTTLAAECGITPAEFTDYNPSSTLCSTLVAGQHVCCSSGTLPDYAPSPYANGTCYTYMVITDDSCSSLAASYDITVDDIETWNANTWGWYGCSNLLAGYTICLSSGYAPQPSTITNAVCGPQVNGTTILPGGTNFSSINECPLNACCDIWGQCGTTTEFCTISESSTGAPGTAAPNQNGCISNCGTDIITSSAPAAHYRIGYFEAYDWSRPCLKASVADINTTAFTHIHMSFATLNADFSVNITDISAQLPYLQGFQGVKRVVSFGGWAFCTDPSTYMIMRDAVSTEANLNALVDSVVNFVKEYDLDGIDWDWEYPGEPDIPGIPAGTQADSTGYFLFLYLLKNSLPSGVTVSFTAPASFWYLQYFDVEAMSQVVDYIVFMTYDLHGQWDYGNAYSDPGCSGGNCLRSHVNLTETINALSMVTKAGVPSNMIAVGVTDYGRSFEMTEAGCWTELCTYVGPDSGAEPGICTGTAGYLADYEINLISSENPSSDLQWDSASYSNIMVWNDTQWVAYMNSTNKAVRTELYEGLTFLGTADWAIDLADPGTDGEDNGSGTSTDSSSASTIYVNPNIWSSATPVVTALPGVTLVWPPLPLTTPTTITFPPWTTTVSYGSLTTTTSTGADGSVTTEPWYVYVSYLTVISIPPVTTTAIPVWGVILPSGSSTGGTIVLSSSIQPEPFDITIYPVFGGTTIIMGATETTTSSATGVIVWGTETYSPPPQTETLGGTTTVKGGTTLPPVTSKVTPNPHPTTVPSTTDPKLNSHPPKWTSGGPPGPTALPGCPGCGTLCLLFCDSGCPFCPPGVFGSSGGGGGGGGGDPDDENSSSSSSSESSESAYLATIYIASDDAETWPATFDAYVDITSAIADEESYWDSVWGVTTSTTPSVIVITTTTTLPPTTSTTTVVVEVTPTADCELWDAGFAYEIEIYNINHWSTDGGAGLKKQEYGCGAVTGWDYVDETDTEFAHVWFYIDFFIKAGCIERAIASAGGPKLSCAKGGLAKKKRDLEIEGGSGSGSGSGHLGRRAQAPAQPVYHAASGAELASLTSVYGTPPASAPTYTPEVWTNTTPVVTMAVITTTLVTS
ncbi:class V chitinase Chi100 [Ustulina deusta]|nr:class V chitinase Chi100 [Ustulina deusta]